MGIKPGEIRWIQARSHTHTTKSKQVLYRYTTERPPPLRCCRKAFIPRKTSRQWSSAQCSLRPSVPCPQPWGRTIGSARTVTRRSEGGQPCNNTRNNNSGCDQANVVVTLRVSGNLYYVLPMHKFQVLPMLIIKKMCNKLKIYGSNYNVCMFQNTRFSDLTNLGSMVYYRKVTFSWKLGYSAATREAIKLCFEYSILSMFSLKRKTKRRFIDLQLFAVIYGKD